MIGSTDTASPVDPFLVEEGIRLCRLGQWQQGLEVLVAAAPLYEVVQPTGVPSHYYSYIGAARAEVEGRYDEGLRLCQVALTRDFFDPENYANLARVDLCRGEVGKAYQSLSRGLTLDPRNRQLKAVRREMPQRRRPVVPFLRRDHPVNVVLGIVRHDLRVPSAKL